MVPAENSPRRRRKIAWAPYLLILPSCLYLLIFFAWPMVRSLALAFYAEETVLNIREAADISSGVRGQLPRGTEIEIIGTQGIRAQNPDELALGSTELWFRVQGQGVTGDLVEGWTIDRRIRTEDVWFRVTGETIDGLMLEGWLPERSVSDDRNDPTSGSVRSDVAEVRDAPGFASEVIGEMVEDTPLTLLEQAEILPELGTVRRNDLEAFREPSLAANINGLIPVGAWVEILERANVEAWYQISGSVEGSETVISGWAPNRFIDLYDPAEGEDVASRGRIDRGDTGRVTLEFIDRMLNERGFRDALVYTFLLMVIILPVQFALAIVMALVLQQRLRGNTVFLYIYAIPSGISDLATGLVWFSIFQQSGFLNSILVGLGVVESPITFINVETIHYIILAIVLAEVWRATSIVMVIVVSGLQAIPLELLEAAELFGAGMWQRLRYVILPLLKPSLQVALILRTILAFQVFAVVIAIAGRAMTVLARETYLWYNDLRNPNMAAAYAGFILLLSMITSIFYLRAIRTQEEQIGS